tara:strand:- start:9286 stop:11118 length:1833 start_codon:yes stop_codon:yes gene_type:complete
MKKTIFSSILFILFLLFIFISYLTFFGYETDRFNKIIKSEIKKSNKLIDLNFKKISILLDLKKLVLYVKFSEPIIVYEQTSIPLKSLRTDVDLEFLTKKKVVVKKILLSTEYLDFNKIKTLINKTKLKKEDFKDINSAEFKVKDLELEFDENLKLRKDLVVKGDIKSANIKISDQYILKNLSANFLYEKNSLYLQDLSWTFNDNEKKEKDFFDGELSIKEKGKNYNVNLIFKTNNALILPKISVMNYSFSKENISKIKTNLSINKNKTIFFKNIHIKDKNNKFELKNLHLDKNYNLIAFKEIQVKTSVDDQINNEFKIINNDKIQILGKVFDAKMLMKELAKDKDENNFLKRISKEIEIDFDKILKGAKFPIRNFRLVGKINKGSFEKILAKSDFEDNKHLDISLEKKEKSNKKILEIYSDIATPLLSDYKFFKGLDGGNLNFVTTYDNINSSSTLKVNDFKLSEAPALAKILSLADLKGLTDTLKGEGISFDTLSVMYKSSSTQLDINEIFMIGPSISILIDGYVEKKSGLISLRGTLVPAKTLNSVISKIPVVGDILIGDKVGEGVFGISFKIKGLPDNLKTTVNPVKTLTPRFITRAIESAKKKGTK